MPFCASCQYRFFRLWVTRTRRAEYNGSMTVKPYDRNAAVAYAKRWAYSRNPKYYDFSRIGGDCTNFASQCIYAGAGVMNFKPLYGWFYRTASDRTPSWTGVEYLYNFLIGNDGLGPRAVEVDLDELEVGDVVQLGYADGDFFHSPVVVEITRSQIYVAAHSIDAFGKPLSAYNAPRRRGIHITGVGAP